MDKVLSAKLYHHDDARLQRTLEVEYKLGFILCFSIYEGLQKYEAQPRTFEEYFPTIIRNVDVAKEKRRWEKFWSRQSEPSKR